MSVGRFLHRIANVEETHRLLSMMFVNSIVDRVFITNNQVQLAVRAALVRTEHDRVGRFVVERTQAQTRRLTRYNREQSAE